MQNFDVEKFISQWWSDLSSPLPFHWEEWIERSYVENENFWEAIFALHQKNKRIPAQSHLGKYYDFYYDCILRHLQSNDLAYTQIEKEKTESWTYRQLHHCVNFHVRKWSSYNVQPGQFIALVISPGIEFTI